MVVISFIYLDFYRHKLIRVLNQRGTAWNFLCKFHEDFDSIRSHYLLSNGNRVKLCGLKPLIQEKLIGLGLTLPLEKVIDSIIIVTSDFFFCKYCILKRPSLAM